MLAVLLSRQSLFRFPPAMVDCCLIALVRAGDFAEARAGIAQYSLVDLTVTGLAAAVITPSLVDVVGVITLLFWIG